MMDNILDRIEYEERERELNGSVNDEDREILSIVNDEFGDYDVEVDELDNIYGYGWDDGTDW